MVVPRVIKIFRNILTQDAQRKLIEALAILNVILLILGAIYGWKLSQITTENHRLAREGAQAHGVVCAYKKNLVRRVKNEKKLLKDNPHAKTIDADPGEGVFLISRELLQTTLALDRSDLATTKDLVC